MSSAGAGPSNVQPSAVWHRPKLRDLSSVGTGSCHVICLLLVHDDVSSLLVQAQAMSSPEEVQRRWQVVLSYHGGSAKLWREHLQWQRAQYASFAVPQLRASYQKAVQVGPYRRGCAHTDRGNCLPYIMEAGFYCSWRVGPHFCFPLLLTSSSSVSLP